MIILKTLKPINTLKNIPFPKCSGICKEFESLGPMGCYNVCPFKFKKENSSVFTSINVNRIISKFFKRFTLHRT